jgi:hypothetical protein
MSGPEIRGRLVLDDAASATTAKIAQGLHHIDERVKHTTGELGSLMRQAVATTLGFQFDRGIHSAMELGHEVFGAAKQMRETQKALAGVVMMTDRTGMSFEGALDKGYKLHEELEMIGVKAGVADDALMEAFQSIAARSKKSTEEVTRFLEVSATVGKVVPGGLAGITAGFANIEMGIIRARNPVVQLVAASGILGAKLHNAREVAKAMMKMSQEDQLKTAEAAINRMHEKVKAMPLSFAQLSESMKGMREQVMVAMGEPLLRALTPPLTKLRGYFLANKEHIEQWAKSVGEKVGEWMTSAAESFRDGFQYLQSHAEEISSAIKSAMHTVREVVGWLLEHKETIGIMFGAKLGIGMAAPMVAPAISAAMSAASGGGGVGAALMAGGAALAPMAAAAAAVTATFYALDQAVKLYKENLGDHGAGYQDEVARKQRLEDMGKGAGVIDTKEFERVRAAFIDNASAMGMTSRAAEEYVDSLWKQHQAVRTQAAELDEFAAKATEGEYTEQIAAAFHWVETYNQARAAGNASLAQYAADVLAKSEGLQNAFLAAGVNVEGGFDALAGLVSGKSADFAKILKSYSVGGQSIGGPAGKALNVNMNGGQTFHIKQDFKDKDPDRIALIFRRDIAKAALSRTASRFGSPFGI